MVENTTDHYFVRNIIDRNYCRFVPKVHLNIFGQHQFHIPTLVIISWPIHPFT